MTIGRRLCLERLLGSSAILHVSAAHGTTCHRVPGLVLDNHQSRGAWAHVWLGFYINCVNTAFEKLSMQPGDTLHVYSS